MNTVLSTEESQHLSLLLQKIEDPTAQNLLQKIKQRTTPTSQKLAAVAEAERILEEDTKFHIDPFPATVAGPENTLVQVWLSIPSQKTEAIAPTTRTQEECP
jgi:hypothetical protein